MRTVQIGRSFILAIIVTLSALFAQQSKADSFAFSTGTPDSTPAGTGLVGFEFTLNQNIHLTQLGFYAQSIGGGDTPHVALLDVTAGQSNPPTVIYDTGNIVGSVPVEPGFNYVSVGTPIALTTGHTYEVSAPLYFSEQFNDLSSFSFASVLATESLLKGGGWSGWDPTNGNPTQVYDYTAQNTSSGNYVSADFAFTADPVVPEPASLGLIAVGAVALLARRRKA